MGDKQISEWKPRLKKELITMGKMIGVMMFWVIVTFYPLATIMSVLIGESWHQIFTDPHSYHDDGSGIFVMIAWGYGLACGIWLWHVWPWASRGEEIKF